MPPLIIGCKGAVLIHDPRFFVGTLPVIFFISHYSSEALTKDLLNINRQMKEAYVSLYTYLGNLAWNTP